MTRLLLALVAILLVGTCFWSGRAISRPPGVLAPDDPVQQDVADGPHWELDGYDVHALARFELRARVLSVERYRWDRESDLSPVDLALGWGLMSSNEVLDTLDISQYGRFFFYSWSASTKVSSADVAQHASNMHMIPADDATRSLLLRARRGNLVHLRGWLVEAQGPDGWRWKSSLSRRDTGGGACELVLVEEAELE